MTKVQLPLIVKIELKIHLLLRVWDGKIPRYTVQNEALLCEIPLSHMNM